VAALRSDLLSTLQQEAVSVGQEVAALRSDLLSTLQQEAVSVGQEAAQRATHGVLREQQLQLDEFRCQMSEDLEERVDAMVATLDEQSGIQHSSTAALRLDMEALKSEMADALGDGVQMCRQVLALHGTDASISQQVAIAEDEEVLWQLKAVQNKFERTEAQQQEAVAEVRTRCSEFTGNLRLLRSDADRLASKLEAGEQNSSRGIALLQRAVEVVNAEQEDLRRTVSRYFEAPRTGPPEHIRQSGLLALSLTAQGSGGESILRSSAQQRSSRQHNVRWADDDDVHTAFEG